MATTPCAPNRRLWSRFWLAAFVVFGFVGGGRAVQLEDPANYQVKRTWSGASLTIPAPLGGLMFSPDGVTLYAVGASETGSSALYAVPVTRDPATKEVIDLGPAAAVTKVFDGTATGLDAGIEVGPAGTLFYTYWSANKLGQRPGGVAGAETVYDMAAVGVPRSIAGLTFSPHLTDPATGFGLMQISAWQGANLYDVPLTPAGGGLFTPGAVTHFVTLPRQGTGAIQYVPSGPLAGNVMYVNWDYGEVRVLTIDPATGLPIDKNTGLPTRGTTTPVDVRFAYELGVGPWGLEFDPLTNDFFLGTWNGNPANTILQIGGAGFPPPESSTTTTVPPSSTTTTPSSSTTSSTLAEGCPVTPTLASINCRLAALIAAVRGSAADTRVKDQIARRLERAKKRKEAAERKLDQGRNRQASNMLRVTIRDLIGASRLVKSLRGKRRVPTELRDLVLVGIEGVTGDIKTVRAGLKTPRRR
jgi:hypothetical protein